MATKTKHDLLIEKIRSQYETPKINVPSQETPKKEENWWQSLLLDSSRISGNFQKGFYKSFEGLLDFGSSLVGSGLDLLGLNDAAKSVYDFGARDLTQEYLESDFNKWASYLSGGLTLWTSGINVDEWAESTYGQQERLPSLIADLSTGAGNLVGMIAGSKGLGALGGLVGKAGSVASQVGAKVGQWGSIVGMSGGQSYEQALNDGASGLEATGYGILSGATEAVSEAVVGKLLGKIGIGTGKVLGIGKGTAQTAVNTTASPLRTAMTNIMKNFTEEGAEEVFSDLVSPLLQTLTYKQGEDLGKVYGEELGTSFEEVSSNLAETFLVGGILGGISGTATTVVGAKNMGSLEGYNLTQEVSALEEVNEEIKKELRKVKNDSTITDGSNTAKVQELYDKKAKIQEALQTKYKKFIDDVESGRIDPEEVKRRIKEREVDVNFARQLNREGAVDELKKQSAKSTTNTIGRDLRLEVDREIGKTVTRNHIRVDMGDYQVNADGTKTELKGSSWDGAKKRLVVKASQAKLNKITEILGHEFGHIFSNETVIDLLLEELSQEDYNRIYEKTYNDYSKLKGFDQMTPEEQKRYIREEIACDVLGGYFDNLNQLERSFKKMDAKGIAKLYYNIRGMFDEAPRKNRNFKKVMQLIEQNRADVLEKWSQEQVSEEQNKENQTKYKLDTESDSGETEQKDSTNDGRNIHKTDRYRESKTSHTRRGTNLLNTRGWNVDTSTRKIVERIYQQEEQFLNNDIRKKFDKILYKLDNTQSETATEEYINGVDEYGTKRLIEEVGENARYSVEPKTVPIDDDFDGTKGYKITLEYDEYKIKGLDWYESNVDKRDEIEAKYDDGEISETAYENRLEKINEKVQEAVDEVESVLQALEDYDLEDMEQYETIPTPKQIEKIFNYAYNIQILVGDEFPNVTVDFEQYLDADSKINELYSYVSQPKTVKAEQVIQEETKVEKNTEEKQYATVAPYYSKEVSLNTIEETNKEIKEKFYSKATEIAKAFGIKITNMDTNMGGFEFQEGENKGKSVNEVSYTFELEECSETEADLFASLMGDLGHENQEAVIAMNYLNLDAQADIIEFEIKVNDLNQLEKALKTANIKDYTINIDKKTVKILDFSGGSSEFLTSYRLLSEELKKGNNFYGQEHRKISSRYLDRESRRNTYESWLAEIERGKREGSSNLYSKKGQPVSESLEEQKTLIQSAIEELYKVSLKHQQDVKPETIDESINNEPAKQEKSERAVTLENTFKETLEKHAEIEEIATDVSELFTDEQMPEIQEALDYMVNGWMTNRERYYGLDFFYRNLTRKQTSAKSMCGAVENVLGKIEAIYTIIEENAVSWMKDGDLEKLGKALDLISNLYDITNKIYAELGDDDSNIFDSRNSVDDEYNYETVIESLDSFGDTGSSYDKLVKDLESKIQAVKNGQIRKKSVNVNRGAEAITYGNEGRIDYTSPKMSGVEAGSGQARTIEPVNEKGKKISEQKQDGQELPTSSVGTIEESGNESSGIHTDSETVVEQPQTVETVEETTEQPVETPTETHEVEPEHVIPVNEMTTKAKKVKVVVEKVRTVVIKNTRFKSPRDNAKTVRWGAELYNKKVYHKKSDVIPLMERIGKYIHKEYGQTLIVEGKGIDMLHDEIHAILNSIDKEMTTEKKIDTIYELIAKHINPNKTMKKTIKKMIKERIENGGKKSRMQKLIDATTEEAREKYAKELDQAYDNLKEALDMVDLYQESINELNKEIESIKEQSEESNKENERKIKEYKKIIHSLTAELKKELTRDSKNKAKIVEMRNTLNEIQDKLYKKEIEVKKLKKQLKSANTRKTTISTALHGEKVVSSKFRQGLDAIDFKGLVDDGGAIKGELMDDSTYNKIAHALSRNDIDDAVRQYLEFVGEYEVTDADGSVRKLNDGSPEWNEFGKAMKQFFKDYFEQAPVSQTKQLKNQIADKDILMKSTVSLIKSSYAIKNKLKKNKGVVQVIGDICRNLLKKIGRPSLTNLKNGKYREAFAEVYKRITAKGVLDTLDVEFDSDVLKMISEIANGTGELTTEEIQNVGKVMAYMSKFLTKSAGSKVHDGMTDRQRAIQGIKKQKSLGERQKWHAFLNALSPRVVFKYMDAFDDSINTYIYNKLLEGESVEQETFVKLFGIMRNFYKTPEGKEVKKNINKKVTIEFQGKNGVRKITATVGEFVSIWKLLQRSDSRTHIANSGISIPVRNAFGKVTGINPEYFNNDVLDNFEKALDQQFKFTSKDSMYAKYIEATVEFFNMARDLKIAVDEERMGYSNVLSNEEYFPIKVVAHDRLMQLGENTDYMRTNMQGSRNYSWNASVEGLKGMLEISSVEEVIQLYSVQMSRYVGYAETIDMINTLYNYQLQDSDLEEGLHKGETLRSVMAKQFGTDKSQKSNALKYINKLLKDVQGIRSSDDSVFEKIRSRFALYQLGANLKVMANQLSALPTAIRYLGLGNYLKAHKTLLTLGFDTKVDDMPYTAQYRIMEKNIVGAQTLNDNIRKVAGVFGAGMTFTDNLVIKTIWTACKMQCNNDIAKATELFDKIIRETQGFNTLQRSSLLRSDNSLIKQMMMFTIQPSHNLSNIMEYILHANASKKTGAKITAEQRSVYLKSIAGIMIEGAMYTAIGLLFKYLLGRDEDDEYEIENILESYFNDNIIGMIPFLNNIELDFQAEGSPIKFNDFNLGAISQVYEAFEELNNVIFFQTESPEEWFKSLTYSVGMLTGIPTRNINNYGTMILKAISPDTAYNWEIKSSGASLYNKEIVNNAIERKQTKKAWNYYKAYTNNIVELDENTTKFMFDLYASGYTGAYIKQIPNYIDTEDATIVVDKEKFRKTYSKVSVALKKLISDYRFVSLSDIKKEKLIKKLVNYYYQIAYKEQSGEKLSNIELLISQETVNTKTLLYLNEIASIEETSKMTRKEAVQQYINKLPITRNEKYLIYFLAGYKLTEEKQKLVKTFLRSKGVGNKTLNALFE